ncbi:MAG: Na+-driven multidrug efflux pump [Chloroflexi bacterium]|jgi:putative MATE family efflux protein|nr:MAG: Na+-driven multidrug efflux pump [Chloroflexota bacterium]
MVKVTGSHPKDNKNDPPLHERDLTKGSIPRNLWWLAWPQIIENILNVVDQLVDLVWAGFISVSTIAGVGIAQSYKQLVMTGRMGLDTAMRAMIARAIGAGDKASANHAALQGFTISAFYSFSIALIGFLLAVPLMRILGLGEDIITAGAPYLKIQFIGTGAMAFRQTSGTALLASGDAITPMKATLLTRLTHIALTPFLIFGWLGLPEMGIAGAAAADLLAQSLGAIWNLRTLFLGSSRLKLSLKKYRLDLPLIARLIRIGAPASVTGMERSIAQLVVVGIAAQFSTLAVAAFSLARRVENVAHLGSGGLGRASGVLVAQNLGANQATRARQTVKWALFFVFSIGFALALLLILTAPLFVTLFSRDPDLVSIGATWIRIQSLSIVFLAAGQVFGQSFNTAGYTFAPMIVTLVSMWLIEIPLALLLTGTEHTISVLGQAITLPILAHLGEFGIAWAIVFAMIVRALLFIPFYKSDRWLNVKLI